MKLSNKILLGFFGVIFLYLTAAFAELRISGTPNVIDDKNSIAETVDISGVAYLVVKDVDKEINVIGSDRARLEVRSIAGDLLKRFHYEVSGDTLTLSGFQSDEVRKIKITVFVPKAGLKGITVNSCVVAIQGLELPVLNISQESGNIWMTESKIARIQMDLSRSVMDISGTKVDTLSATIERSQVTIYSHVGLMQGVMKNESSLRLTDLGEIQLKKDESSRLTLYQ